MKNVVFRGMGKSSFFLANIISTSTVYSSLPKISLSLSNQALLKKFELNSNTITIDSGITKKSLSSEYIAPKIESAYDANFSRTLSGIFEAFDSNTEKPETLVLSSSNSIQLTSDCCDILNTNYRTLFNITDHELFPQLLNIKNLVIINPDFHILLCVKNYYESIAKNNIENESIQPLNIVAITEVSSDRFIQRKAPFVLKYHDMSNDIILFDAVDLNPYKKEDTNNEVLDFFSNVNNDVRKLVNIRIRDLKTFKVKMLMSTFTNAYIEAFSILYEVDPLVMKDALTDQVYLDSFNKYISEFQWYVSVNEPQLIEDFGGSIEKSPFNTSSMKQYISDVTSKKGDPQALYTNDQYTNRLALVKMDPLYRINHIKEAPPAKVESSLVTKIGLNQFFKTFTFKVNDSKFHMPETYSLFQLCIHKMKLNGYKKQKVRMDYKSDVEFIKNLLPQKE
ncbi:unnamed protein product [Hanseniaspora opuntiae]